jgi:hypothetical protein
LSSNGYNSFTPLASKHLSPLILRWQRALGFQAETIKRLNLSQKKRNVQLCIKVRFGDKVVEKECYYLGFWFVNGLVKPIDFENF